jgi:chitinase
MSGLLHKAALCARVGVVGLFALVSACGGSSDDWIFCGDEEGLSIFCQGTCSPQEGQAFTCKYVGDTSAGPSGIAGFSGGTGTSGATGYSGITGSSGSVSGSATGFTGNTGSVTGSSGFSGATTGAYAIGGDGGVACPVDAGACVSIVKTLLGYRVLDAAYSRAVDRVVIVTDSPSSVHLLDPHTMNDVAIALPSAPTAVAVSPDGEHAAVGHDGFVSYVDLMAQTLVQTFPLSAPVGSVALTDTGYVYAIPSSDQWVALYILDVTTGTVTMGDSNEIYAGTKGVVSADSMTLYLADNGLSPSSLYRYDISTPTAPTETQENFGDDYSICGNLWTSKDGSLLYTACGHVFHGSDLSYDGSLSSLASVIGVDDFSSDGTVAALGVTSAYSLTTDTPNLPTAVQTFSPTYLQPGTVLPLPPLAAPGGVAPSDGRFVFHDAAGTGTVVLLHASDPVSQVDVFGVTVL